MAVNSPAININVENYNVVGNTIYISWDNIGGVDINDNSVLFTIAIKSKKDKVVSENDIVVNSEFVTEIFNTNSDVSNLELEIRTDEEVPYLATQLIKNQPNPFSDYTKVEFELIQDSEVNIKLYSVNGSEIFNSNQIFTKGNHTIEFSKDNFPESGVYYLQIETNSWSSSVKMIRI